MLYYDHGLGKAFGSYADYYDGGQDVDAIVYLTLANMLIHEVRPKAITIAEEMSGMPGLAIPFKDGGIGFDYRMAMGIPDYWIKTLKEKKDEDWHPTSIFWELTNRRADEKTISYVESHDQALVGDKTVIFRLIDSKMYWHMMVGDNDADVARGMALHKMIRLVTLSTINGGYLNFMGNEFGHPEWIDFPARAMAGAISMHAANGTSWTVRTCSTVSSMRLITQWSSWCRISIIFSRNLSKSCGRKTTTRYSPLCAANTSSCSTSTHSRASAITASLPPAGSYTTVLSSDNPAFGGFGNVDETVTHFTVPDPLYEPAGLGRLMLYLPARTAIVLRKRRTRK